MKGLCSHWQFQCFDALLGSTTTTSVCIKQLIRMFSHVSFYPSSAALYVSINVTFAKYYTTLERGVPIGRMESGPSREGRCLQRLGRLCGAYPGIEANFIFKRRLKTALYCLKERAHHSCYNSIFGLLSRSKI